MVTYYKATRPDGLSFRGDPQVSYTRKDGTPRTSVVRPAPFDGEPELCGPGMLHVSDTPAETLAGCSWPCRLFEVQPVGPILATDGHKRGVAGLRVVRELPAHLALGPNGEHLVALIERTGRLTGSEANNLAARDTVRDAAERAARDAARDAAWDAARDATRYAARYAAWGAVGDAADAAWSAARSAAGSAAGYAASSAAAGLVVRDLISTKHYDTLTLPWRQVVGRIHPDDPEVTA